jgi:hypothetical protein
MRAASVLHRALGVLGLTLLVMVLNVSASVLYMVVYGAVLAPGHDDAHYHAHAAVAAPYSSVIVGIPLMFFAARWLARRRGFLDGFAIALVYIAIDLAIIAAAGGLGKLAVIVSVSFATKAAAAYAGARPHSLPAVHSRPSDESATSRCA